jgi:deoxyribonuclease-4
MPIWNGIHKAIIGVNNMGGNCLQIFVTNPMSGRVSDKALLHYKEYANDIKQLLQETNSKLYIHSAYTFNFAKDKIGHSWLNCYWVDSYIKELSIAHEINAVGCVIHVGKSLDLSVQKATRNMYDGLSFVIKAIKKAALNSIIILETGAGQGSEMFLTDNNSLDKLANFYNMFSEDQKKYIKLCVDTCHIFSAGYCINDVKLCKQFFAEFEEKIGFDHLALIHLNDSKKQCSSKVDRHENLGRGLIGMKSIKEVIKTAYIYNIPIILETPEPNPDKIIAIDEIALIRKIINRKK